MHLCKILWFNGEYGVVSAPTVFTCFIHRNQAVHPYCDSGDDPAYCAMGIGDFAFHVIRVFSVVNGKRGLRADMWCREEDYQKALVDIENRPTYRFMEWTGDLPPTRLYNPRQYRYREVWRGKNLNLAKYHEPRDGTTVKTYYERWDGEKWTEVADPRIK